MKTYGKKFWEEIENSARECQKNLDASHNFTHIERVLKNLKKICKNQNVDWNLIRIACLFHDTGYSRSMENHSEESCQIAKEFLNKINFDQNKIEKIMEIIRNHHGSWSSQNRCLEGKLLWVADKIDWVSPYGLFRALIQKSNLKSMDEMISWYIDMVKKEEIDKIDDEKLREILNKNWKITKSILKKMNR